MKISQRGKFQSPAMISRFLKILELLIFANLISTVTIGYFDICRVLKSANKCTF